MTEQDLTALAKEGRRQLTDGDFGSPEDKAYQWVDGLCGEIERVNAKYLTLKAERDEQAQASEEMWVQFNRVVAERDALQAEKEQDAWHRGWKVAVEERDIARRVVVELGVEVDALKSQLEMLRHDAVPLSEHGCDGSENCACQECSVSRTLEMLRHDGWGKP